MRRIGNARFQSTEGHVKHLAAILVALGLASASTMAQSGASRPTQPAQKASGNWKVPRTPDGKPDLQGVWGNNGVTPMTRPTQWKDKESLTDEEVRELQTLLSRYIDEGGDAIFSSFVQMALNLKESGKYSQLSYDRTTGNYNQFWMVARDWDNRTSLVTDPPNGQLPALTPAGEARRAAETSRVPAETSENGIAGPADSYEDRGLGDRCISFGAPRTGAGYNSYVQIAQSPEAVVVLQEMIHDARIVPLDGRPHLPADVRQRHGDPRGRWDGDTLVVETRNFLSGFQGSTANVKVTERYTRVSADYINWEVTVDDAETWVRPWTFMIRLKRTDDLLYEYACHEGNHSMVGILAGARAEEARAAAAKK
jgi:hypothetical protein